MIAMRSIDDILSKTNFLQTTEEIMTICSANYIKEANTYINTITIDSSEEKVFHKLKSMESRGFKITRCVKATGYSLDTTHHKVTFKKRKTVCKHIFGKKITTRYSSNGKFVWSYKHTFYEFLTYCENLFLGKGA